MVIRYGPPEYERLHTGRHQHAGRRRGTRGTFPENDESHVAQAFFCPGNIESACAQVPGACPLSNYCAHLPSVGEDMINLDPEEEGSQDCTTKEHGHEVRH